MILSTKQPKPSPVICGSRVPKHNNIETYREGSNGHYGMLKNYDL
jgi:hypothetical protein